MKFLLWLFNFAGRHRRDIRRYEKERNLVELLQ